ncbi:hypothetical protein [Flavobacterium sp.]|uniref:hypothetical protein n=1 Tax=Flavobacterium sp. TaxID=239 RepID=UPI002606FF17|nr:hypothetical protein [Flavobacterium sp.]
MRTFENLKKFTLILLLSIVLPVQTYAMDTATAPGNEPKTEEAYAAKLMHRLEEIKAMDRSNMTRADKRALRKEVKGIKKELATAGGGVYLSVGAIIIVILLLILIL